MYSYRNTSQQDIRVANVGRVEAGKTITSLFEINHPWLERVEEEKPAKNTKKDT